MGEMVEGVWYAEDSPGGNVSKDGQWKRTPSMLRNMIGVDDRYPAEPGRYHLYVAWNCPWAHRALLGRAVLGLEEALPVSYLAPRRTEAGWVFDPAQGYVDAQYQSNALHEIYARGHPRYTGRATVPLLYDSASDTLVSNESADILRSLCTAFLPFAKHPRNLVPSALLSEIDALNTTIHSGLNNAVYRAGFAETQAAYDQAVATVFQTLDMLEDRLKDREWLMGDALTETDLRLFPTLARFDVAYHVAFRCTRRRLIDYPRLWTYARRFYALPGVAETVDFDIYRQGYFSPSPKRNPLGIVPMPPEISWHLTE